ncbi:MAG: DUF2283 domain-containing protein [Candidatus Omnitrophota bacterium]
MFTETKVVTKHIAEGINADYDSGGKLAGLEVLDAVKRLSDKASFKKITLEEIALSS